jgi:hypothetical protein
MGCVIAMATYRIEWSDGRVDLANGVYAARALVLARYPGTLFVPEEITGDGASTLCYQRRSEGGDGEEQRRPIAVLHHDP